MSSGVSALPSSLKRTRLRSLGSPAGSPGCVDAVGERHRDLALLGHAELGRRAGRVVAEVGLLVEEERAVAAGGVADRAPDQDAQRRLVVVVALLERRVALGAHDRDRVLALRRAGPSSGPSACSPSSWPSSSRGFGVAVGVASPGEAATSSLLSGRIIIAIATPAPRNAAVAIRPVIRRAQRDAFRLGGSRLRLRSACTFRAFLSIPRGSSPNALGPSIGPRTQLWPPVPSRRDERLGVIDIKVDLGHGGRTDVGRPGERCRAALTLCSAVHGPHVLMEAMAQAHGSRTCMTTSSIADTKMNTPISGCKLPCIDARTELRVLSGEPRRVSSKSIRMDGCVPLTATILVDRAPTYRATRRYRRSTTFFVSLVLPIVTSSVAVTVVRLSLSLRLGRSVASSVAPAVSRSRRARARATSRPGGARRARRRARGRSPSRRRCCAGAVRRRARRSAGGSAATRRRRARRAASERSRSAGRASARGWASASRRRAAGSRSPSRSAVAVAVGVAVASLSASAWRSASRSASASASRWAWRRRRRGRRRRRRRRRRRQPAALDLHAAVAHVRPGAVVLDAEEAGARVALRVRRRVAVDLDPVEPDHDQLAVDGGLHHVPLAVRLERERERRPGWRSGRSRSTPVVRVTSLSVGSIWIS